jgi:hypothetical protein
MYNVQSVLDLFIECGWDRDSQLDLLESFVDSLGPEVLKEFYKFLELQAAREEEASNTSDREIY